jgi:uncharacterized Zn finger protein (UPF0148 family)
MNRVDEQSWRLRLETGRHAQGAMPAGRKNRIYLCDRCGSRMFELNCKVICPNCGSRFDCSDLSINFDEREE